MSCRASSGSSTHTASGFQNAADLGDCYSLFWHQVQDTIRNNHVYALGVDRQGCRLPLAHLYMDQAAHRRTTPRSMSHRRGHIDTDRPSLWSHMERRQQEIRTSTTADVDDGGAWRQRCDRVRIPNTGERLGHRARQLRELGSVVVEPS
jgi:hypothetical protein